MSLKSIALIVVAMLLVIGSVAATTHMGAEEPVPPAEIGYWCEPKPYGGVLDARLDIGYGRPELPGSSELPPLRLLTIEEVKEEWPIILTILGQPRTYATQAEKQEWHNRLREVQDIIFRFPYISGTALGRDGFILVYLPGDKLTVDEAPAAASEVYARITDVAERLGIRDVPIAFTLTGYSPWEYWWEYITPVP